MAGLNEIHAFISAKIYGRNEERTPGGRRKYQWGRYDCLKDMEVGETINRWTDKRSWEIYRSMASRLGKDYGVRFSLHYHNGLLTITRTI